jgi:hypothetical protein
MSTVPSGTRFIGIAENVNLTERKSAVLNSDTQAYTIQDLADTVGVGAQGPQGVQGPAGPLGPVGPAGLNWQGAWVSGTSYVADDAVGYGGASYFCILATSGTTTPNLATTNWALLASQGAQGIQGVQGPTGAQGASGGAGTLQQTVDNGNTIDSFEGSILSISGTEVKIQDSLGGRLWMEYTSGGKPTIQFGIPNSGGLRTDLQTPDVQTGNRTIKLPDASGTLALTSDLSLQQAFNNGKTMTTGNFTAAVFDLAPGLSIKNTSSLSETTVETTKITFTKNQGGLKTTNLFQAVTPTVNRAVYLPDADGTIALLPTVAGDYINDIAAAAAGIAVGNLYHTAGVVKIRLT